MLGRILTNIARQVISVRSFEDADRVFIEIIEDLVSYLVGFPNEPEELKTVPLVVKKPSISDVALDDARKRYFRAIEGFESYERGPFHEIKSVVKSLPVPNEEFEGARKRFFGAMNNFESYLAASKHNKLNILERDPCGSLDLIFFPWSGDSARPRCRNPANERRLANRERRQALRERAMRGELPAYKE